MASGQRFLFRSIMVCALSLSIGWGIRGNFGHAFGAIGWAFGGTISYMMVIAYTHSGHWPSQVYGFACLCVIGFTWGAMGGAGTALPACLDRERLTSLFLPMLAVFAAWFLQDLVIPLVVPPQPSGSRHESVLYWYDTCWVAALVAIVA